MRHGGVREIQTEPNKNISEPVNLKTTEQSLSDPQPPLLPLPALSTQLRSLNEKKTKLFEKYMILSEYKQKVKCVHMAETKLALETS